MCAVSAPQFYTRSKDMLSGTSAFLPWISCAIRFSLGFFKLTFKNVHPWPSFRSPPSVADFWKIESSNQQWAQRLAAKTLSSPELLRRQQQQFCIYITSAFGIFSVSRNPPLFTSYAYMIKACWANLLFVILYTFCGSLRNLRIIFSPPITKMLPYKTVDWIFFPDMIHSEYEYSG